MTTLDPAHLPSKHHDHRGNAVLRPRGASGSSRKPPIPDLRFEQSYLLSIQSFISFAPTASSSSSSSIPKKNAPTASSGKTERRANERAAAEKLTLADSGNTGENEVVDSLYGAPVDIKWRGVAWVTARDQIISPLIQGAVWGVLGMFLLPVTGRARQSVRAFLGFDRRPLHVARTGSEDIGWWRRWVRSFYSGVETNVALSR